MRLNLIVKIYKVTFAYIIILRRELSMEKLVKFIIFTYLLCNNINSVWYRNEGTCCCLVDELEY